MTVSHPIQRIQPARRKPETGRLRRWLLTAAPLAVVAIVMAIGGLVALYIHDNNRRGATALSNNLIDAVDQRIALQFGAYLAPAEQLVDSARAIAGELGAAEGGAAVEPLVLQTLAKHPELAGFSYADPE